MDIDAEVSVTTIGGNKVAKLQLRAGDSLRQVKLHLQETLGYALRSQILLTDLAVELKEESVTLASLPQPLALTLVLRPFRQDLALQVAVVDGHAEAVKALLSRNRDSHATLHLQDALHCSASHGHKAVVEALLSGVDEHERRRMLQPTAECGGETALHNAVRFGDPNTCQVLLESAAQTGEGECRRLLHAKDSQGRTALHYAAEQGHEIICRALCESATAVEEDSYGDTALHYAAKRGLDSICQVLLELTSAERRCALLRGNFNGYTPLHYAAGDGKESTLCTVLAFTTPSEQSSMLATPTRRGWSPLHYAALRGREGSVRALLDRATSAEELTEMLSFKDAAGHTPFGLALEHSKPAAALPILLVSSESERREMLSAQDTKGSTLMFLATSSRNEGLVRALVDLGAAAGKGPTVASREPSWLTGSSIAEAT